MDATAAAILLAARILVLGPDGTRLVSEHKAGIPPGATGLIKESLHEPGFPSSIHIYITPLPAGPAPKGAETPPPLRLKLREEIWADSKAADSGSRPDEVNQEEVEIPPSGSSLTQLAEDPSAERRLLLTIAVDTQEEAKVPVVPQPARAPREIALRVETYRDEGGARDLADQRLLMTLEGRPVAWELTRRPVSATAQPSGQPSDSGVSLSLTPVSVNSGWISVEVSFRVRLMPVPPATDPVTSESKTTKMVPLGIPFEVTLPSPAPKGTAGADSAPETYVVVVTPFLPAGAPDG